MAKPPLQQSVAGPAAGAWHFRGATVLDGHDPEGNVVQFKQLDV